MDDLRLLLFSDCNRRCKGCCNKDWDLPNLPLCQTVKGYKQIMLTGGEPLLNPNLVKQTADWIRHENPEAKIYVYTAKTTPADALIDVLNFVDGLTVTLHVRNDVKDFEKFSDTLAIMQAAVPSLQNKSLRLNVFKGISLEGIRTTGWIVKDNIEWIKDCPLPENEVFMRL